MRKINYIVVHCSATREDCSLTVEALKREHLLRGFASIGYHYYIRRDGKVVPTRPVAQAGAHVRGYNKYSIGLCYEGGLAVDGSPKDTRTPEQRAALRSLVAKLLRRFPNARLCGHRDLSPDLNGNGVVEPAEWTKMCPCFDVAQEL